MTPKMPRLRDNEEQRIQDALVMYLQARGWFVKRLIGNATQSGMPDLFACHPVFKIRLIELKLASRTGEVFTPAQRRDFPLLSAHGAGIWVLTGADDHNYKLLMQPENWWTYLSVHRKA